MRTRGGTPELVQAVSTLDGVLHSDYRNCCVAHAYKRGHQSRNTLSIFFHCRKARSDPYLEALCAGTCSKVKLHPPPAAIGNSSSPPPHSYSSAFESFGIMIEKIAQKMESEDPLCADKISYHNPTNPTPIASSINERKLAYIEASYSIAITENSK